MECDRICENISPITAIYMKGKDRPAVPGPDSLRAWVFLENSPEDLRKNARHAII